MKNWSFFAVFLSLAFSTSCLKKQDLNKEDLGPVFTPQELSKTMTDGFGTVDVAEIKQNEFSSLVVTQRIQDSFMQTVMQQDMTISKATVAPDKLTLDVNVTRTDFNAGQSFPQAPRAWSEVFPLGTSQTTQGIKTASDIQRPYFLVYLFQAYAFGSCGKDGTNAETCYGLVTTDFKYRVPPMASEQHGCADSANCFINARKIEYDTISNTQVDKDGKPRRSHFTFILSKEAPFLSRVLQFCQRGLWEVTNSQQKVVVDQCFDVANYTFGTTP